jgi:hypothetical protein
MSSFSRDDTYARSESGGEVLGELFNLLSKTSAADPSIQDLLNAINNKRGESVSDVVARYREQTGLDLVLSENEATVKVAAGPKSVPETEHIQRSLHHWVQDWAAVMTAFTDLHNKLVDTDELLADQLYREMQPIEDAMRSALQVYHQSNLTELLQRPSLSKRQAQTATPHPILSDAGACADIESFCSCSGGHKSPLSIILSLREKLGREDISYTDPELLAFINKCKAKHQQSCSQDHQHFEAGQVGTQKDDHNEDRVADYFKSAR